MKTTNCNHKWKMCTNMRRVMKCGRTFCTKCGIEKKNTNDWTLIDDGLPNYYKTVLIKLKSGAIEAAWLASDGNNYIWTMSNTDYTYNNNDIVKWKPTKTSKFSNN